MVYWFASVAERMPVVMDAVLQKYFPEKTWGAIPLINERGEVELVTILVVANTMTKVSGRTMPTFSCVMMELGR